MEYFHDNKPFYRETLIVGSIFYEYANFARALFSNWTKD